MFYQEGKAKKADVVVKKKFKGSEIESQMIDEDLQDLDMMDSTPINAV